MRNPKRIEKRGPPRRSRVLLACIAVCALFGSSVARSANNSCAAAPTTHAFGAYDNGNFSTPEQTNTKQVMGRLTAYPFGSAYRYQGLGLTGFYNYGYGNVAPDIGSAIPLI